MDAESYISQYGESLTDAEKRYIQAFGAPKFTTGASRNPSTPGIGIADAHDGGAASTTVTEPHQT